MKKKSRKKKIEQNKKILKIINIVIIFCIVVLIVEIGYGVFSKFFKEEKHVYFDGINSVIKINNGYAAVGSNNNNNHYYERAKFTIYDSNREKKTEKLYNKGFNSAFFDVCSSDDDFVAVGSYESTEKEHNNAVRKALIVKYDKEGNIVFDKKYKVLNNSRFNSVIKVDDGYIVVGQSVYENTKVGNSKSGGAIIVKYNLDGKLLWEKSFGNSKSATYNDVILYDGYLYAVGKDDNRVGIISKYDLDGNIIVSNDYKYTDALGFTGIVELNNNLYVSTGKRITDNDTDGMIVKYDTDLTYLKEESYNGGSIERFNKIISDSKDHIIMIGNSSTSDNNSTINYDGLIAKYDADLDKIAVVTYGDEKNDYFNDIVLDDVDYLVAGYSSYEDESYYAKFIMYSDALKVLVTE